MTEKFSDCHTRWEGLWYHPENHNYTSAALNLASLKGFKGKCRIRMFKNRRKGDGQPTYLFTISSLTEDDSDVEEIEVKYNEHEPSLADKVAELKEVMRQGSVNGNRIELPSVSQANAGCLWRERRNRRVMWITSYRTGSSEEDRNHMLKVGDTIKCRDADDMIKYMGELAKDGIETDFLYAGEGGFVLIVEEVRTQEDKMQVELRQGQTISDWIPVECAYPEDGREVLVTVQEDLGFDSISNAFPRVVTSVTTAVYEAGTDTFKWFNGHGNLSAYTRVIAWSELPGGYRR